MGEISGSLITDTQQDLVSQTKVKLYNKVLLHRLIFFDSYLTNTKPIQI
jgi:hypothetical protein